MTLVKRPGTPPAVGWAPTPGLPFKDPLLVFEEGLRFVVVTAGLVKRLAWAPGEVLYWGATTGFLWYSGFYNGAPPNRFGEGRLRFEIPPPGRGPFEGFLV